MGKEAKPRTARGHSWSKSPPSIQRFIFSPNLSHLFFPNKTFQRMQCPTSAPSRTWASVKETQLLLVVLKLKSHDKSDNHLFADVSTIRANYKFKEIVCDGQRWLTLWTTYQRSWMSYPHSKRPVAAAEVQCKWASWAAGPWWQTCRCVWSSSLQNPLASAENPQSREKKNLHLLKQSKTLCAVHTVYRAEAIITWIQWTYEHSWKEDKQVVSHISAPHSITFKVVSK